MNSSTAGGDHHGKTHEQPPLGVPGHLRHRLMPQSKSEKAQVDQSTTAPPVNANPIRCMLSMTGKSHSELRIATISPAFSHH